MSVPIVWQQGRWTIENRHQHAPAERLLYLCFEGIAMRPCNLKLTHDDVVWMKKYEIQHDAAWTAYYQRQANEKSSADVF